MDNLTQDILDLIVPVSLKVSPDGKHVVYGMRRKWNHKKSEFTLASLWLADTSRAKSAVQITDGTCNDWSPQWSPDSRTIGFMSNRYHPGKACAIYLMDLAYRNPWPVTPEMSKARIAKSDFSPDGKSIAFIRPPEKTDSKPGDPIVLGENHVYNHLYHLDLESRTIRPLFEKACHVSDFAWSEDSSQMAITTHRSPDVESGYLHGVTVWLLTIATGDLRQIANIPRMANGLKWVDSKLWFLAHNKLEEVTSGQAMYWLDLTKEPLEYHKKVLDPEACPMSLSRGSSGLIVHLEKGMQDQLRTLDTNKTIFSSTKRIVEFDCARHADIIAIKQGDVNNPTEVFSLDPSGSMLQLSDHGNAFRDRTFGHPKFLTCRSLDNLEDIQALSLTPAQHALPSGQPKQPLPTIVLLHGGPYTRITDAFDIWHPFHIMIPLFLASGYAILIPNYRGSSGRGERFASYARAGMGKYDYEDVVAVTSHAINEGLVDKQRVLAAGWSQGGFLAYLCAVRNGLARGPDASDDNSSAELSWKWKANVTGAGITDWHSLILTTDVPYWQAEHVGITPWEVNTLEKAALLRQGSALFEFKHAAEAKRIPPLLMVHGEKDVRTPVSQAHGFRRAMESAGLPFEFVVYPREGHHFTERKHVEDLFVRTLEFVSKHLG